MSKPGQVLANIYNVSRTTISRIKRGNSHNQYKEEYDKLSLQERQDIYKIFCKSNNFIEKKVNSTIIQSKRKLTEQQIHLILYNFENKIVSRIRMCEIVGVSSAYTLDCIKNGLTYKDFYLTYQKLNNEQKEQLASLLRNQ